MTALSSVAARRAARCARELAVVLGALVAGCNAGLIEMSPREEMTPRGDAGTTADADAPLDGAPGEDPRTVFDEDVWPILDADCAACHAADRTGPAFLAADPTPYEELFEWPSLVDLGDPGASRLLTKGEHAGPAFTDAQASTVERWIGMEAAERRSGGGDGGMPAPETFETDPVAIEDGLNEIDLAPAGVANASITFIASSVGAGIYLSELRVNAGAGGARLEHPTLVMWEGSEPEPDAVDRFAGIDVSAAPYSSELIGSGSASLVDFPEEGRLSFVFDSAATLEGGDGGVPTTDGGMPMGDGGTGGTGSGCSAVTAFTENAQPQFGSLCVTCHGGSDSTATAAVDMTSMDDLSAEGQQAACNEILARANLADPAASILFQKPDPASGLTHPFKFVSSTQLDSFRDAVLAWLTME